MTTMQCPTRDNMAGFFVQMIYNIPLLKTQTGLCE